MPARRIVMLLAACALAAPAAPSAATADTGGTAAPEPGAPLLAPRGVLVGDAATFTGTLGTRHAGGTVRIERRDADDGAWLAIASATIAADGTYAARWTADVAGRIRVRAVLGDRATAALSAEAPPEAGVTVYRPAVASWYGPGFYGRRTACGKTMTKRLLGVAHRTLPCGTRVALTYEGNTITVPVVDRGPFKPGRRWDLTAATAKALGFTFTDTIGAVRVG